MMYDIRIGNFQITYLPFRLHISSETRGVLQKRVPLNLRKEQMIQTWRCGNSSQIDAVMTT